jgi:hypothetical protein
LQPFWVAWWNLALSHFVQRIHTVYATWLTMSWLCDPGPPKQSLLLLMLIGRSVVTRCHITLQCHSPLFITSGRHCVILQHHRKGEYRTIRYFERQRDRDREKL